MGLQSLRHKIERRLARRLAARPLVKDDGAAMVSFTFDDVPQSACRAGRDVLERHGCRGTYYVCGGLTDATRAGGERFHSRADLQDLLERGHEIACHGYSHVDFQTLSPEQMTAEVNRNREFFRELGCADRVANFAYPYGCVSPAVKRLVGPQYASARGVWRGLNAGRADAALLRAEPLYQHLWPERALIELIDRNARSGGWLVFFTHGVVQQPDRFGCRAELLDLAVRQTLASGSRVLTVAQALEHWSRPA